MSFLYIMSSTCLAWELNTQWTLNATNFINTQFNQLSCVSRWCNKCLVSHLGSLKILYHIFTNRTITMIFRICLRPRLCTQYLSQHIPDQEHVSYLWKSSLQLHNKKGLEMSNFLFMGALYAYTHSNYSFTTKEWISTSLWTLKNST